MEEQSELQIHYRDELQQVETHRAKSWRGVSVQYSRLRLPTEYEFTWEGTSHYLAHHDLILLDGEMEVAGDKPIAARDLQDTMTFVPQGQTITGWAKPANRMNAFTVVCFDPSAMHEELEAEFKSFEPRPHIYFKADVLGQTMRKLASVMADDHQPASRIYGETIGLTAAIEMFRLSKDGQIAPREIKSGQLSASRQAAVLGYIEENLASDIGLDELAALCGLTRFHFARAFKATFGNSPHQYVLDRRVERAKKMLAGTSFSMAEIGAASGFAGSSQFARSFRMATGKTPLAFRRDA